MITTDKLIFTVDEVPSYWVFEQYCNLDTKLTGQTEKIKSIFNPMERTPSFVLYVKDNEYRFTDFSTGISGSKIDLIRKIYGLSFPEAVNKLISDYRNYLAHNDYDNVQRIKSKAVYRVDTYVRRSWTKDDAQFWTKFNISSQILEKYNVIPASSFLLERECEGSIKSTNIVSPTIYMYCRNDGACYKVYQPTSPTFKFMKVKNYIQGTDQLKFEMPNLIICSSLKDLMSLSAFGFNAEYVAPDSETSLIPSSIMTMYKDRYKKIITLFDNDEAGKKSAAIYEKDYDIPSVIVPLSKDLSDSVRDHGLVKTREVLYPLLKEAINK